MMSAVLPSSTRWTVAVVKKSADLDKVRIPYTWEKSVSCPVLSSHDLSVSSFCTFTDPC